MRCKDPLERPEPMCEKCKAAAPLGPVASPDPASPLPQVPTLAPQPFHPPAANTRRRRKLWELSSRYHCALLGTCLPLPEMRRIAVRHGYETSGVSDYTIHCLLVTRCQSRTRIAEQVQRYLDQRYALAVLRFTRLGDAAEVLAQWREDLACGQDVAGALWAAWTHQHIDDGSADLVFGEIHMLSHQVGAGARADLRLLERLKKEHADLLKANKHTQQELVRLRRTHDRERNRLARELEAAQAQLARYARLQTEFEQAQRLRQEHQALVEHTQSLAARIDTLTGRNDDLQRSHQSSERQLSEAREQLRASEDALALLFADSPVAADACRLPGPAQPRLSGRCVLCIGGRQGLVHGYRRLVEALEGRFLHHDGGLEQSLHRLHAIVAGADAVICQSGCVSHGAYWKIKDACKKLGKPCVFVQSPGIVSFARTLETLSTQDQAAAAPQPPQAPPYA